MDSVGALKGRLRGSFSISDPPVSRPALFEGCKYGRKVDTLW